eukprot:6196979-Pleurochrysis_carterae.AAC.1
MLRRSTRYVVSPEPAVDTLERALLAGLGTPARRCLARVLSHCALSSPPFALVPASFSVACPSHASRLQARPRAASWRSCAAASTSSSSRRVG